MSIGLVVLGQFGCVQAMMSSYTHLRFAEQVRKYDPVKKENINEAFAKAYGKIDGNYAAVSPENKVDLTRLVAPESPIRSGHSVTLKMQDGNDKDVTPAEYVCMLNQSAPVISDALKHKKPQEPSYSMPLWLMMVLNNPKTTPSEKVLALQNDDQARKIKDLKYRVAMNAWEQDADKITDDTASGLQVSNSARIEISHAVNPTWQNWALTKGFNGRLLIKSAIATSVGLCMLGTRFQSSSNSIVVPIIGLGGSVMTGLGLGYLLTVPFIDRVECDVPAENPEA